MNPTLPRLQIKRQHEPLTLMWPRPGSPAPVCVTFTKLADWRRFIGEFDLDPRIPASMRDKYNRGQRLYYLGWIDGECIKAGEIAALIALELALRDRYGGQDQAKRRNPESPPMLSSLLSYMVEQDGLTDESLPIFRKYGGGSIIGNLYETTEQWTMRTKQDCALVAVPPMTLVERRNRAAHGDPFDTTPAAGLIEVVRDLIEYAYRGFIGEAGKKNGAGVR